MLHCRETFLPYFIEYSTFFTLRMMLKYTLKVAEKGFKMAFMMNKLATINFCEIIHQKKICQKLLCNSGAHYTCMCIILDKIG
jgi:hypothetical protein